ncbi:LysR family transcriptional regulator [Aestuariispira insulae]|uniref:LysR family glycine cleavage system transcriptional activator n=1 Tax=Aestuariispira insulae TaxID=1461337 RepID=A0A3D9HB17_9PROT|nr:LysR family transcriptional regulator [Aestuariispira insulae]RED46186.1 LysR family glycine cleavage system transcriptional activator [Aestuariispira insulae]
MNKPLPPLNWLRAFDAAARHLSFTGAAGELNMTQSAVSQQIKALESFLGNPLFIRKSRQLELTNTAQAYLPTVDAAFKLLAEGTQTVLGVDQDQMLEIRSNLAFSKYWLTPRIGRFLKANPWVRLNNTTVIWPDKAPLVPNASVEIAFGDAAALPFQSGARLTEETFYPVCAPNQAKTFTKPKELLDQRLLDVSGIIEGWDSWLRAAGVEIPPLLRIDMASTYVVTLPLALEGCGIAMGHDMICGTLMERGELVRPFEIGCPLREAYFLMPPFGGKSNAASTAFRQWILQEFDLGN